ncbi:hypothetical protein [Streptomyces sp. NPDC101455]|uniref:hypothetical protein n=1 Tax=Streptomyces sp. NPDC101455 TaxID=3366142 RepID=UPI0038169F0B
MTSPDDHHSVYLAGQTKARAVLRELFGGHVAETVADEIAEAVLNEALPLDAANRIAIPGAEGYGEPVHWTVYNAMHKRAVRAENALGEARRQPPADRA